MRTTTAICVLGLLLLVGPLPAQDGKAPPRRAAPDKRAQRGERLRKLADPAGPLGQLFGSLTGDAGAKSPPLDIPRLNEGILALLEPLLDEERGLEYLRLKFDPADTNLGRDTVHLVGAARLRHSAWSDEPTQIDLDLHGTMQRRDDGRPKGILDGQLRFQTDVVALANRAMTRFADRLDRRAQQGSVREGPLNADEAFRLRLREKLAATPPLQNMDDVVDLILSFSGLRLTAINDRVDELKAEVASTTDEKARANLVKQLDAARRQRDQMLDLRPQVERDKAGLAVAMRVALDRSQVDETTRVERLKVEITDKQISLDLLGNTLQGMELYAIAKPLLLNTLTRIQSRDPDTARLGRSMMRNYLGQLRETVGEPGESAAPPKPARPPSELPPPVPPKK
jgi:hypothetical protein